MSRIKIKTNMVGAQWLSGRMLDSRPRGLRLEPHRHHCVVSLSKNINPSLVLVQPRKTRPFITERLLMGWKESNHTYIYKTNMVACALSKDSRYLSVAICLNNYYSGYR